MKSDSPKKDIFGPYLNWPKMCSYVQLPFSSSSYTSITISFFDDDLFPWTFHLDSAIRKENCCPASTTVSVSVTLRGFPLDSNTGRTWGSGQRLSSLNRKAKSFFFLLPFFSDFILCFFLNIWFFCFFCIFFTYLKLSCSLICWAISSSWYIKHIYANIYVLAIHMMFI